MAAGLAALAADAAAAPVASGAGWGKAHSLGTCTLAAPALAFPSRAPDSATGPGALAWLASVRGCAPRGRPELRLLPLDFNGQPQRPRTGGLGAEAGSSVASPAAVGAGLGEVAVLAPGPGNHRQVLAGRAGGRLRRELTLPGSGPAVLARAYLGDVAAASASGGRIRLGLRRYFRRGFRPRASFAVGSAPVTALALALDYRSEVLVAWEQSGTIYARLMRNWGRLDPIQRVGPSAPGPALQAMLSDNGHAMVAWATSAGGGQTTTLKIALSDAGTHFDAPPRRIGAFADPAGLARRPTSLGLVRLAGENVVLAWTAYEGGHYRVRAAPAVFAGVRPSQALSPAGQDATLEALAAGPANEALTVWQAGGDRSVCSVVIGAGDRVLPCAAQDLTAVRSATPVAAAIDPGSDRPMLAWRDDASRVDYVTGSPLRDYRAHGYAPAASLPRSGNGVHWVRITGAVVAAVAACGAIVLLARRRRRARPG